MRRLTLRLRIVLVLLGLVAAGLLVVDVVTHESLQAYLLDRVDQQLNEAAYTISQYLSGGVTGIVTLPKSYNSGTLPPAGTYGALVTADGRVITPVLFDYLGTNRALPRLPRDLVALATKAGGVTYLSVAASNGAPNAYRLEVYGPYTDGTVMVAGIPLTDVNATLGHILWIEILVSVLVLAGLGVAAWWLVRHELRPLEGMAGTAAAIAGGDLTRRVEPAEPDTEVGRLGLALNAMLSQIEDAFEKQEASEKRLRRFLADASHELRTPLTSIRGYAELFHRGAAQRPEDLAIAMRRIEGEARRMGIMVEELLLLARLDDDRPLAHDPVDLALVVSDAVHDARVTDPQRTITLQSPAFLVVEGDDGRLRQVAANLLGNTVRHTPTGCPVDVTLAAEDGEAVFTVADHGPGISPEDRAMVFQPFFRLEEGRSRHTGGAGLGLAIVKSVVEAHGGSVAVAETDGGGATFVVRLPIAPVADEEPAEATEEGVIGEPAAAADGAEPVPPSAGEAAAAADGPAAPAAGNETPAPLPRLGRDE